MLQIAGTHNQPHMTLCIIVYIIINCLYIYRSFCERTTNRLPRGERVRRFAICSAGPINQNKQAEPNRIITST